MQLFDLVSLIDLILIDLISFMLFILLLLYYIINFTTTCRVAFKGSLEEECSVKTPEEEQACKEYNEKMDQLSAILKQEREPLRQIEDLVKQLKGIKLPKAPPLSSGTPKPDTKAAIAEAKAAVAKFGADSVEAKLAWETVEEIAASDNSVSSQSSLDEECLLELEEACATLHEFNDIIETAARF